MLRSLPSRYLRHPPAKRLLPPCVRTVAATRARSADCGPRCIAGDGDSESTFRSRPGAVAYVPISSSHDGGLRCLWMAASGTHAQSTDSSLAPMHPTGSRSFAGMSSAIVPTPTLLSRPGGPWSAFGNTKMSTRLPRLLRQPSNRWSNPTRSRSGRNLSSCTLDERPRHSPTGALAAVRSAPAGNKVVPRSSGHGGSMGRLELQIRNPRELAIAPSTVSPLFITAGDSRRHPVGAHYSVRLPPQIGKPCAGLRRRGPSAWEAGGQPAHKKPDLH